MIENNKSKMKDLEEINLMMEEYFDDLLIREKKLKPHISYEVDDELLSLIEEIKDKPIILIEK